MIVWVVAQDHIEHAIMNVLTQMGMMIVASIIPVHLLVREMGKLLAGIILVQILPQIVLKLPAQIQIVVYI